MKNILWIRLSLYSLGIILLAMFYILKQFDYTFVMFAVSLLLCTSLMLEIIDDRKHNKRALLKIVITTTIFIGLCLIAIRLI